MWNVLKRLMVESPKSKDTEDTGKHIYWSDELLRIMSDIEIHEFEVSYNEKQIEKELDLSLIKALFEGKKERNEKVFE